MNRIDIELVQRGLCETRSKAQYAIKQKQVYCNQTLVTKNSFLVGEEDILDVLENLPFVSKGGLKLQKAIESFHLHLNGKNMVDIGSSTGGFSDCAITYGIQHILAIDVGTNQFSPKVLRTGKVTLLENTDFREVELSLLKNIDVATIDISFISVIKILPKLTEMNQLKEIVLLIKPQFECGMENARKYQGVILNAPIHLEVIEHIQKEFEKVGFFMHDLTYSPIRGGSGNIEYLSYFTKEKTNSPCIKKIIDDAFLSL